MTLHFILIDRATIQSSIILMDSFLNMSPIESVQWFLGHVTTLLALIVGIPQLIELIKKRQKTPLVKTSPSFAKHAKLRERMSDFIPNDIAVFKQGAEIPVQKGTTSVDHLINHILLHESGVKFNFLEAPTGIGKTTYLINVFLAFAKLVDPVAYHRILAEKKSPKYWLKLFWLTLTSPFRKKTRIRVILADYNDLVVDGSLLDIYRDRDKAKNTVVLIDAMDEYSPGGNLGAQAYWEAFATAWAKLVSQLSDFKTVVISVREQFLDEKNTVMGNNIAGKPYRRIKLQPFSKTQAITYIQRRYNDPEVTQFINHVYDLQDSSTVFCIPLILYYAKDIYTSYREIEAAGWSHYSIFQAIVTRWLQREFEEHSIEAVDIDNIRLFCLKVAHKINGSDTKGNVLHEKALKEVDATVKFNKIFNYSERSLLKKEERKEKDKNGSAVLKNYYEFAHQSFLEYFLVELVLLDPKQYEREINFHRYGLAADMFIKHRWKERKAFVPKARPGDVAVKRTGDLEFSNPTNDFLRRWRTFFSNFSSNEGIHNFLMSSSANEGLFMLEGRDAVVIGELSELKAMSINTENFCSPNNENQDSIGPCSIVMEVAPYIKHFIMEVSLANTPNLTDDELSCFDGVNGLSELILKGNALTGSCIQYFSESRYTLLALDFSNNPVTDDRMLEPLAGADKLQELVLNSNQLDGSCIRYFAKSKHTLTYLNFSRNRIDDDRVLGPLAGADKLQELALGGNQLDGSCIRYFTNSKYTLTELDLSGNGVADDQMLKPLDGADKLQELILDGNQLDGSCIRFFAKSKHTLTLLFLSKNEIKDDKMLEPLAGADKLQALALGGNQLDGSCIRFFENSKHTLTYLQLWKNRIDDDKMLEPLDGADKLQKLGLAGNLLDGSCLQYFAASRNSIDHLSLWGNSITDSNVFAPLDGADKLEFVAIGDNPVGNEIDISYLRHSKHSIKEFYISIDGKKYNAVNDIFDFLHGE